jgi:hypothetical protein
VTKAEQKIRAAREAAEAPTWENQIAFARNKTNEELKPHALVSIRNRHKCQTCYCCAALAVLDERAEKLIQAYRTKGGHLRTRPTPLDGEQRFDEEDDD